MTELREAARRLESEEELGSYVSSVTGALMAGDSWNPSSHTHYSDITSGAEELLEEHAEEENQYGQQVILSYSGSSFDGSQAALNLKFPDIENDMLLSGNLSYRLNDAVGDMQEKVAKINRVAAEEALPEDSSYLEPVPVTAESGEYAPNDIVNISVPASDFDEEELMDDLRTLDEVVEDLDQFYDQKFEIRLRTAARDFMGEDDDGADIPSRDGWTF